ncbi:MAG: DNA-3-methyladenine glycosylase family protein [Acidimicrobiia bacterium]
MHATASPPRWARPSGFPALVLFVLEQQVSLASARSAFLKLHEAMGTIEPAGFLALSDEALRAHGFSRQKTSYCRGIARGMLSGEIDLGAIGAMNDKEASAALTAIRGIGPWTSDVFLLFCLGREDAWPRGDRALHVALAALLDLEAVPDTEAAGEIATRWAPWRGIAAFFLWHDYLGGIAYQDDGRLTDILG